MYEGEITRLALVHQRIASIYLLLKEPSDLDKNLVKALKWQEHYPPCCTESSYWPCKKNEKDNPEDGEKDFIILCHNDVFYGVERCTLDSVRSEIMNRIWLACCAIIFRVFDALTLVGIK